VDDVVNNHGNWRATKKIDHPTKASHELFGLNLSMTAEARNAPVTTMPKVISVRFVLFIARLHL